MSFNSLNNQMTVAAFPKCARLLHAADFKSVFDQPSARSHDQNFTVLARANQLGYARLGMAITKKCLKRAVARNRVKRIIRESFRQHQAALAGLDVVVISRKGIGQSNNPVLFAALEHHWSKLVSRCKSS